MNDNDTTESTSSSVLATIKREWAANGGKMPPKAEAEKLLKLFRGSRGKVEAARLALSDATAAQSEVVTALAEAYGGQSLKIDGVVYDFSARGGMVFLRRKGTDVVEL